MMGVAATLREPDAIFPHFEQSMALPRRPDAAYRNASVRAFLSQQALLNWPVLLFVLPLTVATVLAIVFVMAPRMAEGCVVFNAAPDRPCPFGYRMGWLAIRTRDTRGVVHALGLLRPEAVNWSGGIGSVYDHNLGESRVFVTPPVNGWTFVVGLGLPHPLGPAFVDKFTPFVADLGARFIEVQYFLAYPPLDLFAWARVIDGRVVRAFAVGDEGVILNVGKTTKDERSLGLKLFELRGVKGRKGDAGGALLLHPTEEHVMRLAGRWSIDPVNVEAAPRGEPAVGFIGQIPASWRQERLRRAA
jgi:hypothetical protein